MCSLDQAAETGRSLADAAAAEAGDLIQAGKLPDTTLRDLLAGVSPAIAQDFTVFKSVGIAAQDVAAAEMAFAGGWNVWVGRLWQSMQSMIRASAAISSSPGTSSPSLV